MPRFLFQPDPIDGYEFYPIPIDIHLGIVKIPTEEIYHDDGINNTESITVSTDRNEVLKRLQTGFTRNFRGTENSENQIFGLQIIILGKHGKESGNILRNTLGPKIEYS